MTRKKLAWESALGFVGFFLVLAAIQAVWNVLQPEPAVLPSVLLTVLVVVEWLIWLRYRSLRHSQ